MAENDDHAVPGQALPHGPLQGVSRICRDAAATQLLMNSVSPYFEGVVAGLPTACHAFTRIKTRFVGGSHPESNKAWYTMLSRGMVTGETLEQYCARMENL